MWVPRHRAAVVIVALSLVAPWSRPAACDEPALTRDEMRQFLLTAEVVASRQTSTGVTRPYRLTLSDGTLTHDALFQAVDERAPRRDFVNGRVEINFIDSYRYNLAAYELAGLVGLEDMMPVTVERKWKNQTGALSWWLPVKMDEGTRLAQKVEPPDSTLWNNQMYRVRVFSALVYDTDRNLTNILISDDWKIWMIDFTRGFRLFKTLAAEADLVRCDRNLLERLKALDADAVARATGSHLEKGEIEALLARRDRIVQHFTRLVAEKGEAVVLY
jgi:hypothetical protein